VFRLAWINHDGALRTMTAQSKLVTLMSAALTACSVSVSTAMAQTAAPAAAPVAASDLKIAFNFGLTSDYIFRGFSQTRGNPALQGGVDLTYGIAYAGVWASSLNFNTATDPFIGGPVKASTEVDVYAGIKPVFKTATGDYNFDIGGIYYSYPGAKDPRAELNYFEFKAGVNRDLWKDGNLATTVYFSPEYTQQTGRVWTSETTFTQTFAAWGKIVPLFGATFGYQKGDTQAYKVAVANGATNYIYGNAGVTFTYDEKISLDLRYWDTNIKDNNAGGGFGNSFCTGTVFQCSQRAVATLKFTY
jgi:uncharacterized protein (TIGR02001 family)